MRYDNKGSVRVYICHYQKKHSGVFFYSTNRDKLVVDPTDENRLVPRLGSYKPPPPINAQATNYRARRDKWKRTFNEKTLPEAKAKGGESLGVIYYRWYHIDSPKYSLRYPNPQEVDNTAAVRRVLEDEHIRYPYEFFYSCKAEDLTVSAAHPNRPPKMGSLFPEVYQAPAGTSIPIPSPARSVASGSSPSIQQSSHTSDEEGETQELDPVMMAIAEANVDQDQQQKRQKRMMDNFKEKIMLATVENEDREGNIYCVFHFPGDQGSNEARIIRYGNRPSVRVAIYRYRKKHPDVFYYSTNRNDLVVDPARDPTKLKPRQGSYLPPRPNPNDLLYRNLRSYWKRRFRKESLPAAKAKGGDSLGIIYYRWYHIDSPAYSLRHSDPNPVHNTEAVRQLFEEENVRRPYEFFYSCDPNELEVDPNNPNEPPTLGSLYPADYQPPTGTHTSTPSATVSVPPHTSGAQEQPDLLEMALLEANVNQEGDDHIDDADRDVHNEAYPQYLITLYPSEDNDAGIALPFTASLPASLQYMLGSSSTAPVRAPIVPATTTSGIHTSSSSSKETHYLNNEMENSSESSSDEDNVEIPKDLNQYNVPSGDLHNVQQQGEVEDVEMMDVLDDVIGLEEDFGVANDGVMPNENQILADLHNIEAQEGDAAMLGNALMMGADYNPYDLPPDDEDKG